MDEQKLRQRAIPLSIQKGIDYREAYNMLNSGNTKDPQQKLLESARLIANHMGVDEEAALKLLQRKMKKDDPIQLGAGLNAPEEKQVRADYGVPDYQTIDAEFERNSTLIAQKKNIPLDQAKAMLTQRMDEISQKQKESDQNNMGEVKDIVSDNNRYYDSEKRGFTENLMDYVGNTVLHPIDRAAQIATEATTTIPGLVDVASSIGKSMLELGQTESPSELDFTGAQQFKKGEQKGSETNLSGRLKNAITERLKSIGINPAESKFADTVNIIASTFPEMAAFTGVGKGIGSVAKIVKGLEKGKATAIPAKGLEKVGKFLTEGSDVRKATDVGGNLGGVVLPTVSDVSDPAANVGLSGIGAFLGNKAGLKASRFNKQSRDFKKLMDSDPYNPKYKSEAQKMKERFEEQGLTAHPVNISENKGIKVIGKTAEKSMFGKNIADALGEQRRIISEKITPIHADNFSSSHLGKEASEAYEKNLEAIKDAHTEDFNKVGASVKKYTDQIVPLNKTKEFIDDMFKDLTKHPEDIGLIMNSPAGRFLNLIAAKQVRESVESILSGKAEAKFLTPEQKADLEKVYKRNQKLPEKITDKFGNPIEINDPLLMELIRKKIGGDDVLNNQLISPYMELEYPFLKRAMEELRENTPGKGFSDSKWAKLKDLTSHLWEDIDSSVGAQMKAKSLKDYNHMRKTHADYADFIKNDRKEHNSLVADLENPVEFAKKLVSSARNSSGKKIGFVTEGMTPEARNSFISKINRMFGSGNMANNRQFDPATWQKRYNDLDIESKKEIYGDRLPEFEAISDVVKDLEKVHENRNTSGSFTQANTAIDTSLIYHAGKGLVSGVYYMDPVTIAKAVSPLFLKIAGNKLLTNDTVGKWMIKIQNAKTKNELIDALNGYKAGTKWGAVKTLIKNLQKVIRLSDRNEGRDEYEKKQRERKEKK